jgi:hypothetical protein
MNNLRPPIALSLVILWSLIAIVPVVASADNEAHHHDVPETASNHDHAAHSQGRDAVEQEHDHASHAQGSEINSVSRLGRWLGKFHPVVVHFPIALLITAAGAEFLRSLLGMEWLSNAARYSVLAGTSRCRWCQRLIFRRTAT